MAALRKQMQLGWNLRVFECLKVDQGTFDAGGVVVLSLKQKSRRNLRRRLKRRVDLSIRAGGPTWIDDHLKVGPRIDRGRRNAFTLEVWMSTENRGKMRSGGEANNADAVGIDLPLRCVNARKTHSLLRVFKVFDIFRVVSVLWNPVLHEHARYAERIEPIANLCALDTDREADVAASGKNQRGCASVLRRIGRIDGEVGLADVGDASSGFT